MHEPLASPRLRLLQEEISKNKEQAFRDFWAELTIAEAPIIENIADGSGECLVTFVWRGTKNTASVLLCGDLGYKSLGDLATSKMEQLGDTELWHKTVKARNDLRIAYRISAIENETPNDDIDWKGRIRGGAVADPFNSKTFKGKWVDSVLELPNSPPRSLIEPLPDSLKGDVEKMTFHSEILKNTRDLWTYTPPRYTGESPPYGLLILFDGYAHINWMPTPTILDNLYAKKQIPPLVSVFVGSPDREVELVCYLPFVEFLAEELVPWIRQKFNVTDDPMRTLVGGSSYGGLAAAFAALNYPSVFGKILCQSGSFFRAIGDDDEREWLKRQLPNYPVSDLHFYFDVGLYEGGMLPAIRNMRDALRHRGNTVDYAEFNGGHHSLNWQYAIGSGIKALTKNL